MLGEQIFIHSNIIDYLDWSENRSAFSNSTPKRSDNTSIYSLQLIRPARPIFR